MYTILVDSCGALQDKILQSSSRDRSLLVTNDGATILKSLHIDNPAAKVLIGVQPWRELPWVEMNFRIVRNKGSWQHITHCDVGSSLLDVLLAAFSS